MVKNPAADAGDARDVGSIPGLRRYPGVGNRNPLQYSCLENYMDRGLVVYSPWGHKESYMTSYIIHEESYINRVHAHTRMHTHTHHKLKILCW